MSTTPQQENSLAYCPKCHSGYIADIADIELRAKEHAESMSDDQWFIPCYQSGYIAGATQQDPISRADERAKVAGEIEKLSIYKKQINELQSALTEERSRNNALCMGLMPKDVLDRIKGETKP